MIANVSEHDKQVFFLSALYFYYEKRIHDEVFGALYNPSLADEAKLAIMRRYPKKEDHVRIFLDTIFANAAYASMFSELPKEDAASLLQALLRVFENQQFCAMCESWSFWDIEDPEKFALSVASGMLSLLEFSPCVPHGMSSAVRVRWFEDISDGVIRLEIFTDAVRQMMTHLLDAPGVPLALLP